MYGPSKHHSKVAVAPDATAAPAPVDRNDEPDDEDDASDRSDNTDDEDWEHSVATSAIDPSDESSDDNHADNEDEVTLIFHFKFMFLLFTIQFHVLILQIQ